MSGQLQTIWETLGIEPTADKRAIRHAYACKCRECHPEDHPEEFRLLHQSYEQALDWADKKKEPHTPKRGGENEFFIKTLFPRCVFSIFVLFYRHQRL